MQDHSGLHISWRRKSAWWLKRVPANCRACQVHLYIQVRLAALSTPSWSPGGDQEAGRPEFVWARALHKGNWMAEDAAPVSMPALWRWLEPLSGPHPAGRYKVKAAHEKQGVRTHWQQQRSDKWEGGKTEELQVYSCLEPFSTGLTAL